MTPGATVSCAVEADNNDNNNDRAVTTLLLLNGQTLKLQSFHQYERQGLNDSAQRSMFRMIDVMMFNQSQMNNTCPKSQEASSSLAEISSTIVLRRSSSSVSNALHF